MDDGDSGAGMASRMAVFRKLSDVDPPPSQHSLVEVIIVTLLDVIFPQTRGSRKHPVDGLHGVVEEVAWGRVKGGVQGRGVREGGKGRGATAVATGEGSASGNGGVSGGTMPGLTGASAGVRCQGSRPE